MTKERMPVDRRSITQKIQIGDLEGYCIVGLYPDGRPGEVFLTFHKVGTVERGLGNALAVMISLALQRGVPVIDVVNKLKGMKFEPSGPTGNQSIPMADSIVDFVARWLELRFCNKDAVHE